MNEPKANTCATCAKVMVAGEGNGSHFLVCAYKRFGLLTLTDPDDTCPAYEPKQPKKGTQQ